MVSSAAPAIGEVIPGTWVQKRVGGGRLVSGIAPAWASQICELAIFVVENRFACVARAYAGRSRL